MAEISIALWEVHSRGVSAQIMADKLGLPVEFVTERIEAARLTLLAAEDSVN